MIGRPGGLRTLPNGVIAAIVVVLVLALALALAYALQLGPFAAGTSPTASPTGLHPSAIPSAAHSPGGSGSGTTATPTPTTPVPSSTAAVPSATDAPSRLLAHVPEGLRASCTATLGIDPVVAVAICNPDAGQLQVTYWQYADTDSMSTSYGGFVDQAQIERDSGTCLLDSGGTVTATTGSWPSENSYSAGGEPAGRYLCLIHGDSASVYWTDTQLNILSQATGAATEADRLVGFWLNEAGPIP